MSFMHGLIGGFLTEIGLSSGYSYNNLFAVSYKTLKLCKSFM